MDKKFIRIISPITVVVALLLDISAFGYSIHAINKVIQTTTLLTVAFTIIMLIADVIAIFVTKEVFSNGVEFRKDEVEFVGLDKDNIYAYQDIEKVDYQRDDKISFTKNFNQRHSILVIYLKDDKVATIDLGLTTKKAFLKIVNELNNRTK